MTTFIADAFHDTQSICSIARKANVSSSTVNRILNTIAFPKPALPEALSIDEFKGNAEAGKFQCILVDLANIYFPHAKIIIDKYHFIRQTSWAIEGVR